MAFTSYDFLIFFLVAFVLYWVFPQRRWQNLVLFASGIVFYGWLAPWHAAVLMVSVIADYLLALAMTRWKSRADFFMWSGVALNLALLVSIKYYPSINGILAPWTGQLGIVGRILEERIILPLGVSFYVLKKISYLIEVRRGAQQVTHGFIAYADYVSFFPQVLSGPIDRPQKFLQQLQSSRTWSASNFYDAWQLILMGFFKKFVIANTITVFVDQIFLMKEPSKIFLIAGGLGFAVQILADFSSYTDLSRGFAFLLGLKTAENFNKPYLSLTPGEFWNRWHMSFSFWLRDYVFFPLRRALLRARNLPQSLSMAIPPLVTMFISGLWHGTGLTFIVWGLYYGLLIVLYQWIGLRGDWKPANRWSHFLSWSVMFLIIVFGWIIFRAQSMTWLWNTLLHAPFYRGGGELIACFVVTVMIGFYASLLLAKHVIDEFFPEWTSLHAFYFVTATVLTIIYVNSSSPDFIYFQF